MYEKTLNVKSIVDTARRVEEATPAVQAALRELPHVEAVAHRHEQIQTQVSEVRRVLAQLGALNKYR